MNCALIVGSVSTVRVGVGPSIKKRILAQCLTVVKKSTTIDDKKITMVSSLSKFSVLVEEHEVCSRLNELGLDRDRLKVAADAAYLARLNATPHHPRNAPGILSWVEGVRQLRDSLVGEFWIKSVHEGVEYIQNDLLRVRVGFCNVKYAASKIFDPEPITPRRGSAVRACYANTLQFGFEFGFTPVPKLDKTMTTYYLMVGEDGTAELSLPLKCDSGKFDELVERIFLITASDLDSDPFNEELPDSPEPDIEIIVERKI